MSKKSKDRLRDPALQVTARDHATYPSTFFTCTDVRYLSIIFIHCISDFQVPDTVSKLQSQLPIERAQMRVRLTFPVTSNKWVENSLLGIP